MLLAMRERGGSHERFSLAWFRHHKLELVVALGSAAAAVGGFIGSWAQANEQVEQEKRIGGLHAELSQSRKELAEKSDALANLAKEALSAATGGDSFPMFEVNKDQSAETYFYLKVHGSDAVFDVQADITDESAKRALLARTDVDVHVEAEPYHWTGNLNPYRTTRLPQLLPLAGYEQEYSAIITARNGIWFESYCLQKTGNGWKAWARVLNRGGVEIYKHWDRGFPSQDKAPHQCPPVIPQ